MTETVAAAGVLSGIKVVDFGHYVAGLLLSTVARAVRLDNASSGAMAKTSRGEESHVRRDREGACST